ncbi:hypothetical protein [Parapedobacter indicus]|uniref:Uncharacterized protein n=1 Tax=Parapedobacter indicus TaxID=1477437 RepID=A0A1I3DZE8_9SPHI|nr:hypothetical protein [Parapedobacter indicus]PPL04906.1 hypothetical protein CLV26_101716 [Parapedobacter indicus]SFH92114.1 hypothetical protein SAMN05444682_101702 [Parapedobacter indicus]
MNIEEFISESIKGIVSGITTASTEIKSNGAIINPLVDINGFMEITEGRSVAPIGRKVQEVEMTVAVTASDNETSGQGKVGINVVGFSAGFSTGDSGSQNSTVSTIRFNVPIAFPVGYH